MNRIMRILAPFIALAAAVMFTVFGINGIKTRNSYSDVEAVITDIQSEYDVSDEETDHHVFVKYTVDGEEYENELGEYSASMDIGETISLKYNPENPNDVVTSSYVSVVIEFAVAFIGVIGFVAGGIKLLRGR